MKNYAIINSNLVVNITVSSDEFAKSQGWVELTGNAGIGWSYIDGKFIAPIPPIPSPEQIKQQNKINAVDLLQQTDWTCTVDITNPEYSNPYLMNQDEFLNYRSQIRAIAVNPPTTPAVFPDQPQPIWSN